MKNSMLRTLAVLAAGLATTAAYAAVSLSPGLSDAGDGSPNRPLNAIVAAAHLPLAVDLQCSHMWMGYHSCIASASGGTGFGYTFSWSGVYQTWDNGGGK